MARALEAALVPIVERMKVETRLSPAAQWRCAADSFASAFLSVGRALGAERRMRDEALSVINHPCLQMANPQTGYRDVSIRCADGREVTQAFLKRGGCCRYYTADDAEYCTTCVLRRESEQVARLETYMRVVHEPGLAAQ
jgi:ferric iron reductase protein FhuF